MRRILSELKRIVISVLRWALRIKANSLRPSLLINRFDGLWLTRDQKTSRFRELWRTQASFPPCKLLHN